MFQEKTAAGTAAKIDDPGVNGVHYIRYQVIS